MGGEGDCGGLKGWEINEHFFPNQNIALQEVYAKHQEKRADAKITGITPAELILRGK